jgi:hypothetical protein
MPKTQKKTAVPIKDVLDQIGNALSDVRLYARVMKFTVAAEYSIRAEALLDLLEFAECGSSGSWINDTLFGRYTRLLKKYDPAGLNNAQYIRLQQFQKTKKKG